MSIKRRVLLIATLVTVLGLAMSGLALAATLQARPTILGTHGMVASGHYLASWIGNKILMDGGNAFDAGVAMVLAQSWLEEYNFGFAGEVPILIYSAKDKKVYSIDGDMAAPKSIDAGWFKDNGIVQVPGDGFVAAGVPAAPDALILLLDKFGTMSFSQVAKEPIRLAEEGFPLFDGFVSAVKGIEKKMNGEWPSSKAVLMPDGKLPVVGQVMKNADLANTWKKLCDTEQAALKAGKSRSEALKAVRDRFYKGDIAEAIVKFQKEYAVTDANGMKLHGNLTMEDLASYSAKIREPWMVNYHGYEVYKCGPWTQGPSFLIHLKLLEQFDLQKLGYNSADYWHVMAETMKLAQADKVEWLGDDEYIEVPKTGLLSSSYAAERVKLVDMKKAITDNVPGDPWKYEGRTKPATYPYVPGKYTPRVTFQAAGADIVGESFDWDTTGTRSVDAQGNMFSATPSGGWFTSNPLVPGLGFPLGTRLQMFFVDRTDHARSYVPGARVSTTLSPTLVMKNGKPFMALGMPGGDEQDQQTLQDFLHVADFGADFQEALELPHLATTNMPSLFYPHGRNPGAISLPALVPENVINELKARGHKVNWSANRFSTNATMVGVDPITGVLIGASGPADNSDTRPRYAIGW